MRRSVVGLFLLVMCASTSFAQNVTVTHNVNLRPEQSTALKAIRLLTPSEPPMTLVEPFVQDGYYHVRTTMGEDGYVYSRNVHVSAGAPTGGSTPPPPSGTGGTTPTPANTITIGTGVPGSASMVGCGDGRWEHVYNPSRLMVQQDCVTITGTIADATANQSTHQPDGVRHESDGDTHGWLKVDSQYAGLINAGNSSAEDGNLVFEIVCHYSVKQQDAMSSCAGYRDNTAIPPVGTHVAITGTLVTEKNHAKWNEIHPVSSIKAQ